MHDLSRQRRTAKRAAHPARRAATLALAFPLAVFLGVFAGAGEAVAAIPEICGNGIDDVWQTGGTANGTIGSCPSNFTDAVVGSGCDRLCTNTTHDEDRDGYTDDGSLGAAGTTDTDCDDTRRDVYPGIYVPNSRTSPTGYKLCQTDGTFAATVLNATTPLCEATGSGVCKYVSCASGNDSNAGTYAAPYLTGGKVSGGAGGTVPASPHTLAAGDVVYFMDGGTCTTTFTAADGGVHIIKLTTDGTSSDKIRIKRYPGATVSFAPASGDAIRLSDVSHAVIEGLDSSGFGTIISMHTVDNIEIRNNHIHDPTGLNGDSNQHCIGATTANTVHIHHNFVENCEIASGNNDNSGAIIHLDNDGVGTGSGHRDNFNVIWLDARDDASQRACVRQKHGPIWSDMTSAGHEVKFNYCINYDQFVDFNGSGLRAFYNLGYGTKVGGPRDDAEAGSFTQNEEMKYNTFVQAPNGPTWTPTYGTGFSSLETLNYSYNVLEDTHVSFIPDASDATVSLAAYISDANFTTFTTNTPKNLIVDNNCYESGVTPRFCYGCQSSGSGAGPLGSNYSFANWCSTAGMDCSGFVSSDLNFTAFFYESQDTDCDDIGWTEGYRAAGPGPTPTPSPSPTPTPTPEPNSGRGHVFAQ